MIRLILIRRIGLILYVEHLNILREQMRKIKL
nr:MAG TPA: hypothetical protein [Caudoviricetes sp.]